jgi:hypothetical protein
MGTTSRAEIELNDTFGAFLNPLVPLGATKS